MFSGVAGLLALAAAGSSRAQTASPAAALLGRWTVDLRPSPDAAPALQELLITRVTDELKFEGSFYGAPVSQARINTRWGAVRIAFVTADASGPYHHSAVLREGRLEGLSNSTGRDFLAYWSAVK